MLELALGLVLALGSESALAYLGLEPALVLYYRDAPHIRKPLVLVLGQHLAHSTERKGS